MSHLSTYLCVDGYYYEDLLYFGFSCLKITKKKVEISVLVVSQY